MWLKHPCARVQCWDCAPVGGCDQPRSPSSVSRFSCLAPGAAGGALLASVPWRLAPVVSHVQLLVVYGVCLKGRAVWRTLSQLSQRNWSAVSADRDQPDQQCLVSGSWCSAAVQYCSCPACQASLSSSLLPHSAHKPCMSWACSLPARCLGCKGPASTGSGQLMKKNLCTARTTTFAHFHSGIYDLNSSSFLWSSRAGHANIGINSISEEQPDGTRLPVLVP